MPYDSRQPRARRVMARPLTRRELLQRGGLLFRVAAPTVSAPVVSAPSAVASVAGAAAATVPIPAGPLTVKASEASGYPIFSIDRLAVKAGPLTVNFVVAGNMKHELWFYPNQDVSTLMTTKRAGVSASEPDYLKQLVAQTGVVDAGFTKTVQGTAKPGLYELSAFVKGAGLDGTSFWHFDTGQPLTVAAVGPGGPSELVATPGDTIIVDMVPGTEALADSWLFVPDRLTAKAGDVTFKVNNKLTQNHDFVVYPLGNISQFITSRFTGKEDYTMIQGQQLFEALEAGKSGQKTAKLTPGWWAAACFVVGQNPDGTPFVHRDKGQRFTFLVV
jgi:hypothetical protein